MQKQVRSSLSMPGVTARKNHPTADILAQVLRFNDTTVPYPEHELIHELFATQARRAPGNVAAAFGSERLTYQQLDGRSNQLARELIALGVRPDDRVGIYLERGLQMLIGMLGTLKAGAAYVPLDPHYPLDRAEYMVRDSSPAAILTCSDLLARASVLGRDVLDLDQVPAQSTDPPAVAGLTSRNLAHVIYTSGSTGRPKGVMIEHRNVLRLVVNSNVAIGTNDCVAHCASPSFDVATWEVWAPLLNGGRVAVIPRNVLLDPHALNSALIEHGVSAMILVSGLFNEYADDLEQAFSGLRYLTTGGDVASAGHFARVLGKSAPPSRLINAYGPTEATTMATIYVSRSATEQALPIGRPLANTTVYIVDRNNDLVSPGIAGEICIGGPGVARGYLDRAALTSERFIADRFGDTGGSRLYRTGDLGRWLPDGNIEFLGREDSQVKIRGYRIELGEIEAALCSHPCVEQAIVLARQDESQRKALVGYIELRPEAAESSPAESWPAQLQAHLTTRLPAHMVPAAIMVLPRFPLTENGKVDRGRLPVPSRVPQAATYLAARNDVEGRLIEIWQKKLKLERIGIDEDFFALGGDSISGLAVTAAISKEFNVALSSVTLMRHPTVRSLSACLSTYVRDDGSVVVGSEPRASVSATAKSPNCDRRMHSAEAAPITVQQQLFLDFSQAYPGWTFWCTAELRLRGVLRVEALGDSLRVLEQRHEALRCRLVERSGSVMQQIDAPGMLELKMMNLERDSRRQLKPYIDAFLADYVDPSIGPLVKVHLVKLADEDHVLLVAIHHLITDARSMTQFFEELWRCYVQMIDQAAPMLPPVTMQYSNYCVWQRDELGATLARREHYWREKLQGLAPVRMPSDPQRHDGPGEMGEMKIAFGLRLSDALQSFSKAERAMPALVMAAASGALISTWCGQKEFALPIAVDGRLRAEHAGIVGYLATGLALKVLITQTSSFLDLLSWVSNDFVESYEHLDFGIHSQKTYPELFNATSISWMGDLSAANGVPSRSYWNERAARLRIEPFRVRDMRTEDGLPPSCRFTTQLLWRFQTTSRGVEGHVYYPTGQFTAHYMRTFTGHLRSILKDVMRDPRAPLSSLQRYSYARGRAE